MANFVDLKSPCTLGHARAVAGYAAAAGRQLGWPERDVQTLRQAGLVHGLGRLGVSNSIWDKPGPLGAGEWERVRLFPYLTERMLRQSAWLAPLGAIAVQLRERLDGSGYPRGLSGAAISPPARILAAADVYQSMREPRPYRPARPAPEAAAELRAEVTAGRLDADAAEAVLSVAGHASQAARRPERPAGLTAREVDVLRLAAQGLSSRQIAQRLVISPKTARNHIEHIYVKIGASSRAIGQPVRDAAWPAARAGARPFLNWSPKMRQSPHVAGPGRPYRHGEEADPGPLEESCLSSRKTPPRTSGTSVRPSTAGASWTITPSTSSRSARATRWPPCSRGCLVTAVSARTGDTCWRARSR